MFLYKSFFFQDLKKRKKLKDAEGLSNKKKLKMLRPEKRRKSISVHHHSDGTSSAMMDLTSGNVSIEIFFFFWFQLFGSAIVH